MNEAVTDLFIQEASRSRGTVEALMKRLCSVAKAGGCGHIDWIVLHLKEGGKKFCRRLGATISEKERLVRMTTPPTLLLFGLERSVYTHITLPHRKATAVGLALRSGVEMVLEINNRTSYGSCASEMPGVPALARNAGRFVLLSTAGHELHAQEISLAGAAPRSHTAGRRTTSTCEGRGRTASLGG